MIFKPFIKFVAAKSADFFSMISSIIVCVIESHEKRFGFSATGAFISAVCKNDFLLKSIIISECILAALFWILLNPFCHFGYDFSFMLFVISLPVLANLYAGLFVPLFHIISSALPTSSASPSGNFFKGRIGFLNTACFACPHGVIISQFDYACQERVTTIPSGSRAKRLEAHTAQIGR